ncbi:MAG: hypothetical protein Satyrvirus2_17 [Satyrvirus sp.]|uniref:Uncharacterized protein n=1 Tax=Satyrvirus sp. TaxID=2487771 RepID=A0A3G5ACS4_9VIRU|nr:MAG: hypothetical protein Satyrvirus2_17 [Satyrvirus sp.]
MNNKQNCLPYKLLCSICDTPFTRYKNDTYVGLYEVVNGCIEGDYFTGNETFNIVTDDLKLEENSVICWKCLKNLVEDKKIELKSH